MSRRTRREQRLLNDQDTVGMRRAERKEQEELAGKQKIEAGLTRAKRLIETQEEKTDHPPRRVARVGKPLKR
jgi:hypothetical protein